MLHITVLASGSAGNCAVIESEQSRILLDAGVSCRQIVNRLALAGFSPLEIDAVVLTHEHGDHISGLPVFARHYSIPVYANAATAEVLRLGKMEAHSNWRVFRTGEGFEIKDLAVQSFSVPHDAVDPVGFIFRERGRTRGPRNLSPSGADEGGLGVATDLGHATDHVIEQLAFVQTLLVETNYCEDLLSRDTKRPWPVKQRILSKHGHLSNGAAGKLVGDVLGKNGGAARPLERVILGHLSQDCNTPERALGAMQAAIGAGRGPELHCARADRVSPRFLVC